MHDRCIGASTQARVMDQVYTVLSPFPAPWYLTGVPHAEATTRTESTAGFCAVIAGMVLFLYTRNRQTAMVVKCKTE